MSFKVFISYSTSDLSLVYQLKEWLEVNGIETYLAELDPRPGLLLADKVAQAIEGSDCVIAVVTKGGRRSEWVNQEIGYARRAAKLIVPIVEQGAADQGAPGFLGGAEYVPFKWENPADALRQVTSYLVSAKANKEAQQTATAVTLLVLGLVALAAATGRKE